MAPLLRSGLYLLLSYTSFIVILSVLSRQTPKLAFYVRIFISYISLLLCAAYGLVASIFLRLGGYGQVTQWAAGRSFKWLMWLTTGVEFVVEGKEHLRVRPAVFVANHQT